jgi:hypothetical protein
MTRAHGRIPTPVKLAYTALVAVVVPVYVVEHGPANFLWFSDIALLATLAALWRESRLLASMMAVGTLAFELMWNLDYVARLVTGAHLTGITRYMFDEREPLFVRGLSMFHVVLPPLLLWVLHRLGYDRRALPMQTALAWVVLPVSYVVTDPSANLNWVLGPREPQTWMPPLLYLALLMLGFPLVVYLPTHLVLDRLFGPRTGRLRDGAGREERGPTTGQPGRERQPATGSWDAE